MHVLIKIILSSIGIFFVIYLMVHLLHAISIFFSKPSWRTAGLSLLALLLIAIFMALLVYFLIRQHNTLVKKIAGSEQLPEPDSQIQWLPVSLRLICVAAGIYFLSHFLWRTTYVIDHLARFESRTYSVEGKTFTQIYGGFAPFSFQHLLPWILTLICGVYLLWGAPHFVRWHVKKILQMCQDSAETK